MRAKHYSTASSTKFTILGQKQPGIAFLPIGKLCSRQSIVSATSTGWFDEWCTSEWSWKPTGVSCRLRSCPWDAAQVRCSVRAHNVHASTTSGGQCGRRKPENAQGHCVWQFNLRATYQSKVKLAELIPQPSAAHHTFVLSIPNSVDSGYEW